jgi:hypothetical protein
VPQCGCKDLKDDGYTTSGRYSINLNDGKGEFDVYCDMTLQGGGWTIIQRRVDETVSFDRNRKQYNVGFGKLDGGNFWLGLEKIRRIASSSTHEIYIGMESFLGGGSHLGHARYESFFLGTDAEDYELTLGALNVPGSNAGDSFGPHNNTKFSTPDEDNDGSADHCASDYSSGWWYDDCSTSHLNGIYYTTGTHPSPITVYDGIIWKTWLGLTRSLETVVIAIRPV